MQKNVGLKYSKVNGVDNISIINTSDKDILVKEFQITTNIRMYSPIIVKDGALAAYAPWNGPNLSDIKAVSYWPPENFKEEILATGYRYHFTYGENLTLTPGKTIGLTYSSSVPNLFIKHCKNDNALQVQINNIQSVDKEQNGKNANFYLCYVADKNYWYFWGRKFTGPDAYDAPTSGNLRQIEILNKVKDLLGNQSFDEVQNKIATTNRIFQKQLTGWISIALQRADMQNIEGNDNDWERSFDIKGPVDGILTMPQVSLIDQYDDEFVGEPKVFEISSDGKQFKKSLPDDIKRGISFDKRFTAYYTNYSMYGHKYYASDIPADKISKLAYAFIGHDKNGNLFSVDSWGDSWQFTITLMLKKLYPHLKVELVLGGWDDAVIGTNLSEIDPNAYHPRLAFQELSKKPEARTHLAKNLAAAIKTYNIDGIGIDWEYPEKNDADNYIALLKEIKRAIGQDHELSIAAPAAIDKINYLTDEQWKAVGDVVDEINVMTYDYHGGWDKGNPADFHAPMNAYSGDDDFSIKKTMARFLELVDKGCFAKHQLSLGIPAYGRAVYAKGVDDINRGFRQPVIDVPNGQNDEKGTISTGTFDYKYIEMFRLTKGDLNQIPYPNTNHLPAKMKFIEYAENTDDPAAKKAIMSYGYAADEPGKQGWFLSYDNIASAGYKVKWANTQGFGGVMLWELGGDDPTQSFSIVNSLYDQLKSKIIDPDKDFNYKAQPWNLWFHSARNNLPIPAWPSYSQTSYYYEQPKTEGAFQSNEELVALAALTANQLLFNVKGGMRILNAKPDGTLERDNKTGLIETERKITSFCVRSDKVIYAQEDGSVIVTSLRNILQGNAQAEQTLKTTNKEAAHILLDLPDLGLIAVSERTVSCWPFNQEKGQFYDEAETLEHKHTDTINDMIVLPGNQLVSVSKDNTIGIWRKGSDLYSQVTTLKGHDSPVAAVTLLADGSFVTGDSKGQLKAWKRTESGQFSSDDLKKLQDAYINDLKALPDNGFISASADSTLVFWDVKPDGTIKPKQNHPTPVKSQCQVVVVMPNGDLVAGLPNNSLQVFQFSTWPFPGVIPNFVGPWHYKNNEGSNLLQVCAQYNSIQPAATLLQLNQVNPNLVPRPVQSGKQEKEEKRNSKMSIQVALENKSFVVASLLAQHGASLFAKDNEKNSLLKATGENIIKLLPKSLLDAVPQIQGIYAVKDDLKNLPDNIKNFLQNHRVLAVGMGLALGQTAPELSEIIYNTVDENFDTAVKDMKISNQDDIQAGKKIFQNLLDWGIDSPLTHQEKDTFSQNYIDMSVWNKKYESVLPKAISRKEPDSVKEIIKKLDAFKPPESMDKITEDLESKIKKYVVKNSPFYNKILEKTDEISKKELEITKLQFDQYDLFKKKQDEMNDNEKAAFNKLYEDVTAKTKELVTLKEEVETAKTELNITIDADYNSKYFESLKDELNDKQNELNDKQNEVNNITDELDKIKKKDFWTEEDLKQLDSLEELRIARSEELNTLKQDKNNLEGTLKENTRSKQEEYLNKAEAEQKSYEKRQGYYQAIDAVGNGLLSGNNLAKKMINADIFGMSEKDKKEALEIVSYIEVSIKGVQALSKVVKAFDATKKAFSAVGAAGKAVSAVGKLTSVVGLVGGIFDLVSLGFDLFGPPQPDPTMTALSNISDQVYQMNKQMNEQFDGIRDMLKDINDAISKQLEGISKQIIGISKQIEGISKQVSGLESKIFSLYKDMNKQFAEVRNEIAQATTLQQEGFSATQQLVRRSAQQTMRAVVWGHNDLVARLNFISQGIMVNMGMLQKKLDVTLMDANKLIHIAIENSRSEFPKNDALSLRNNYGQLLEYRNKLQNSIENKLLALGNDDFKTLVTDVADDFNTLDYLVKNITLFVKEHLSECYAHYKIKSSSVTEFRNYNDYANEVYFSISYALEVVGDYLWLQERLSRYLKPDSLEHLTQDIKRFVCEPINTIFQFIDKLSKDTGFFVDSLLADYQHGTSKFFAQVKQISTHVDEVDFRFSEDFTAQPEGLQQIMFSIKPSLSFAQIDLTTIQSELSQQQMKKYLDTMEKYFLSPSQSYRYQTMYHTFLLAHALNVGNLSLVHSKESDKIETVTLKYKASSANNPINLVQLTYSEKILAKSELLIFQQDVANIAYACRQKQVNWIKKWNDQVIQDTNLNIKLLNYCSYSILMYLYIAGYQKSFLDSVACRLWNGNKIQSYISKSNAFLKNPGNDIGVILPITAFEDYTNELINQLKEILGNLNPNAEKTNVFVDYLKHKELEPVLHSADTTSYFIAVQKGVGLYANWGGNDHSNWQKSDGTEVKVTDKGIIFGYNSPQGLGRCSGSVSNAIIKEDYQILITGNGNFTLKIEGLDNNSNPANYQVEVALNDKSPTTIDLRKAIVFCNMQNFNHITIDKIQKSVLISDIVIKSVANKNSNVLPQFVAPRIVRDTYSKLSIFPPEAVNVRDNTNLNQDGENLLNADMK